MDFNTSSIADVASSMYSTLKTVVNIVLPIIIGVVLLIGLIYSIYLGIKYAKAEEADDRNKQKQHLIGAVTGFAITLILIAIINVVLAVVVDNKIKARQDELKTAIAAIEDTGDDSTKTYYELDGNNLKSLKIDNVEFYKDGTQSKTSAVIAGYSVDFIGIDGMSGSDKSPEITAGNIVVHLSHNGTEAKVVVKLKAA